MRWRTSSYSSGSGSDCVEVRAAGRAAREVNLHEAAELLDVTRPYLVGLLEAGEIEHRRVGACRRVMAGSLLDYMRRDDRRRREAADELSAMTRELGFD